MSQSLKTAIRQSTLPQLHIVAKIRKGKPKTERGTVGADLNERLRVQFIPPADVNQFNLFRQLFDTETMTEPGVQRIDLTTRKITFFAPFTDPDMIWDANVVGFGKGGQIARGNGKQWNYLRAHKSIHGHNDLLVRDGFVVREHADVNGVPYAVGDVRPFVTGEPIMLDGKDRPVYPKVRALMNIMIPGFRMNHFQVVTSAWADVYKLVAQWAGLKATAEAFGGSIAGALLDLTRTEHIIQKTVNGNPTLAPHWCLNIAVNPQWADEKLPELSPAAVQFVENVLPEGFVETGDTDDETPNGTVIDAVAVDVKDEPARARTYTTRRIKPTVTAEPTGAPETEPFVVPAWVALPDRVRVPANPDPATVFWMVVNFQTTFDGEPINSNAAKKLLDDCGGDFRAALDLLGTMLDASGEPA